MKTHQQKEKTIRQLAFFKISKKFMRGAKLHDYFSLNFSYKTNLYSKKCLVS